MIAFGRNNDVIIMDILNQEIVYTLSGHTQTVKSVAFNGDILASASKDRTIKLWNVQTGELIDTFTNRNIIFSLEFSPDGNLLCYNNGIDINVRNLTTGEITVLRGHTENIVTITFNPIGNILASCCFDNTIKLWNIETGDEIRTLIGHNDCVLSGAFSSDGRLLASGSFDKSIILWDVETGNEIKTLTSHTNWVRSLIFSPDNKKLISGSRNTTIKVWDVETGDEIRTLNSNGTVFSMSFNDGFDVLVSVYGEGHIIFWKWETGELLDEINDVTSINAVMLPEYNGPILK